MSSKRLDTISDYARHGYRLRIDCRDCGRAVRLDARELTALCSKLRWSRDIVSLSRRLRCSNYAGGNVLWGPAFGD